RGVGDELPPHLRVADVKEDVPRHRKAVPAVGLDDVALNVTEIQLRNHEFSERLSPATRGPLCRDGRHPLSTLDVPDLTVGRARRIRGMRPVDRPGPSLDSRTRTSRTPA